MGASELSYVSWEAVEGKRTEIRQGIVADKFGENGDPTEQVVGYAQVVVLLRTVLAHLTERGNWSIV